MKNFKDFLYNIMDYLLILGIILIVGLVIFWKLNFLLVKPMTSQSSTATSVEETSPKEEENAESVAQGEEKDNETGSEIEGQAPQEAPPEDKPKEEAAPQEKKEEAAPPADQGEVIEVIIPEEMYTEEIGKLLESKGLVSSAKEFDQRAVALKLDTRIRPGTYKIKKGMTIDEILNMISAKRR